jgi:hypothetical protein
MFQNFGKTKKKLCQNGKGIMICFGICISSSWWVINGGKNLGIMK